MISFDEAKQDYITYALDRIEEIEVTREVALKPIDFDPDNYFKYAIGISGDHSAPVKVVLEVENVAAKYLDSLPIHHSQKIVEMNDDHFVFSLFVKVTEDLIREILSYGGDIQVAEPVSLKKAIAERAKKLIH